MAALTAASLLQWLGASAVLPLFPLYLHDNGHSDQMIGIVMAAFFAAGVLSQLVSGLLGDRIGHRTVLLGGLFGYAFFSAGFLMDLGGTGFALLRAGQGATAGAAEVAMLSLATTRVSEQFRGRAVSTVYAGQLTGIAVGPLLGSLVGISHMAYLFLGSSVLAVLAGLPVLTLTRRLPLVATDPTVGTAEATRTGTVPMAGRVLVGTMVAATTIGLLTGVYEACWSLLLDHRGASGWHIGLSWTLFAVPFVLVSPVAGWIADYADRRLQVVFGLLIPIALALVYPWLHDVQWLIGLGMLESIGLAFVLPAAQSLLAGTVPESSLGWAQGRFASFQTAAIAVAAGTSGWMFARAIWLPFTVVAAVSLLLTITVVPLWSGTSGRVRRDGGESSTTVEADRSGRSLRGPRHFSGAADHP
jgi:DHA1 family multidrug resistance protein-like MFS transporter